MLKQFSRALVMSLIAALVLAGCGSAAPAPAAPASGGGVPAPTQASMPKPTGDAMVKPTEGAMARPTNAPSGDAMLSKAPAWLDIQLADVNSGQSFKLSDFKGQVVLVEAMAVWCTNCTRQQRELVNLHSQIGDAAFSVSLDIDLNEDAALLRQHAQSNAFDWRYAVAPSELVQALADEFGNSFLNPTSVPMFLIDTGGGVHQLDFGHKTVEYLSAQIEAYQ